MGIESRSNDKSVWATLGANNHCDHDRANNDYYATDPLAMELLLDVEHFDGSIWENCCGEGHLSKVALKRGYDVVSTDLIDRGFGQGGVDFFECNKTLGDNIVTNPPYIYAQEWVEHSLELLHTGQKLALFLPIRFLESAKRRAMFDITPPKIVYVCSNRISCAINGEFYQKDNDGTIILDKQGTPKKISGAVCYAWFLWIKGEYDTTSIKWIN